jgi:hypothetical protein
MGERLLVNATAATRGAPGEHERRSSLPPAHHFCPFGSFCRWVNNNVTFILFYHLNSQHTGTSLLNWCVDIQQFRLAASGLGLVL